MSGPRRLWSGDWMAESAAARERMAERRAVSGPPVHEATDEHETALAAPPGMTVRERIASAWLGLVAWVRGRRRAGGAVRSRRVGCVRG